MTDSVIGIDIGGTKTAAALITGTGEIAYLIQKPTCQEGPDKGIRQITDLIDDILLIANNKKSNISGIGIGIPAALEKETDRILWAPNIQGWKNVELKDHLEDKYHLPAGIEYDGHAAVLGEWWLGKGKGKQSIVDIVIGTGIGSGAIIDGHLLQGANRLAGAIGWQVLAKRIKMTDQQDQKIGFWENLAAGPGIADFANQTLSPDEIKYISGTKQKIDSKQLFEASKQGYKPAQDITAQVTEWLGIGIANVISILNPEIVILGGSVGTACDFLLPDIQRISKTWSQPVSGQTAQIVISDLGTNAGLLGAAFGILMRLKNESKKFINGGEK
ncbi:MAG: ROK family protein [Anaerolineaceae bacterium]